MRPRPDIGAFDTPRPFTTVADGDHVFGLRIVGTPGHTPGHIAVLDEVGGLLVAGDAVIVKDGVLQGPDPDNTMDMPTALQSVKKMAGPDVRDPARRPRRPDPDGRIEGDGEGGRRLLREFAPARRRRGAAGSSVIIG